VAGDGARCYLQSRAAVAESAGRGTTQLQHQEEDADVRKKKRARLLAPGFDLRRHVVVFAALAVAGLAVAAWLARSARLRDLWVIPAFLLVANLIEYLVHRVLMHRPLRPRIFYKSHTLGHHRAFHHDSMQVESWQELSLVVMSSFTMALLFAGIGPLVALVAWGLGRGVAGLVLMTGVLTFVLFEVMHALYHFPLPALARWRVTDNRVFRALYRYHQQHHRLVRMRWTNFNISFPLLDRVAGTLETEEEWQASRKQPAKQAARADAAAVSAGGEEPPVGESKRPDSEAA
jgi:hypothetical protein